MNSLRLNLHPNPRLTFYLKLRLDGLKIILPPHYNKNHAFLCFQELVPPDTLTELANSREQIRLITNSVSRVKQITDGLANRSQA